MAYARAYGLSPATTGLLAASLATREHTAAVEAHRQFFDDTIAPRLAPEVLACAAIAVVNDGHSGLATCSVDDAFVASLPAASLETATAADGTPVPVYRALRHDFPTPVAANVVAGAPEVVLYGELGSAAFASAHARLQQAAETGQVSYAVRHRPDPAAAATRPRATLTGFGVEMAIKSTEYKVLDDTLVDDDGAHGDDERCGWRDAGGYVFFFSLGTTSLAPWGRVDGLSRGRIGNRG